MLVVDGLRVVLNLLELGCLRENLTSEKESFVWVLLLQPWFKHKAKSAFGCDSKQNS